MRLWQRKWDGDFRGVVECGRYVLQLTCPKAMGYTPPFRKWPISNGLRYVGPRSARPRRALLYPKDLGFSGDTLPCPTDCFSKTNLTPTTSRGTGSNYDS